jgi:geranylgeranyl pyrophosphate synthase
LAIAGPTRHHAGLASVGEQKREAGLDLPAYLADKRTKVNEALENALPPRHPDAGKLVEAMRYTLLLPGKRLRGIVCLATADAFGAKEKDALVLACAVEMVHASSLILDDLPQFDDADLRRGEPANHLRYDQATAILAAVGLLTSAFRHLAGQLPSRWLGPDAGSACAVALADAIGENGMLAGEALDLLARGRQLGLAAVEQIHALKTGSLFIAATVEAARLAGAGAYEQAALRAYAKNLGLAFQITDDLLEVDSTHQQTGKLSRTVDQAPTFVAIAGIDGARQIVQELIDTAVTSLEPLAQRAETLRAIARATASRHA